MKKKILLLLTAALFFLTACGGGNNGTEGNEPAPVEKPAASKKIEKIIVMAPSLTESVIDLGMKDKIIATDTVSAELEGVPKGLPTFDMMSPNSEELVALQPDLILVSGMSSSGGEDPFTSVKDAGIDVVEFPSAENMEEIKNDVKKLSALLGTEEKGEEIIKEMDKTIAYYRKKSSEITDKKSVYFEIGADPYYSFGSDVYIDEMLQLVGAKNIFSDRKGWLNVEEESIIVANPDVILTTVDYIDDPVGNIMSRPGWSAVPAVKNKAVYRLKDPHFNLPNHNVVDALDELAKTIYPEVYQ